MSREDFKSVRISINRLLLDTSNARIRAGLNQDDCIQRIISKEDQTLTLIEDILQNGLTTAPIIVSPTGEENYVVWDGNRRVTALKLIQKPALCPILSMKKKIVALKLKHPEFKVSRVECLSSTNTDALINEILHRHAGALGGAGQLDWHAYMKTVFFLNHGKGADYKKSGQYLLWAESNGLIVEDDFPISSLQRFFTIENLENLGFDASDESNLTLTTSTQTAKAMASKIISDFSNGKPVREVFEPEDAKKYIEEVRESVGLDKTNVSKDLLSNNTQPSSDSLKNSENNGSLDNSPSKLTGSPASQPTSPPKNSIKPSWERPSLFPKNKDELGVPSDHTKAKNIVAELKRLKSYGTKSTPIAVAMLLRALLEISTDRYYSVFNLKDEQSFHSRIAKTADHMHTKKYISDDQKAVITRLSRDEESMLHVKTIQKYVHSAAFHPDGQSLNTLWDQVSFYIKICWKVQTSV